MDKYIFYDSCTREATAFSLIRTVAALLYHIIETHRCFFIIAQHESAPMLFSFLVTTFMYAFNFENYSMRLVLDSVIIGWFQPLDLLMLKAFEDKKSKYGPTEW